MRRKFLSLLAGLPAIGLAAAVQSNSRMKVMIKSAWGSSDPTQASFPFHHARAFAEAGHEVQIYLLGEAVTVMRTVVANAILPVGWPPLSEGLKEVIAQEDPDTRLRRVREGPWGPRSRPGREERDVCQPENICRPGAMG